MVGIVFPTVFCLRLCPKIRPSRSIGLEQKSPFAPRSRIYIRREEVNGDSKQKLKSKRKKALGFQPKNIDIEKTVGIVFPTVFCLRLCPKIRPRISSSPCEPRRSSGDEHIRGMHREPSCPLRDVRSCGTPTWSFRSSQIPAASLR